MAVMPDIFGDLASEYRQREHDAAGTMRHLMRHGAPPPAAAPPAPQPTATPTTPEEPMSLQVISEIEEHIKTAMEHVAAGAAKFEQIDKAALRDIDAIRANPETAEILAIVSQLTGAPAGTLATGLGVLRMILAAAGGQLPAPVVQPDGGATAMQPTGVM